MDSRITPVKRTRVSEQVFKQLYAMISERIYKPGDQLPSERDLAEKFEVSRASVREAIRTLDTMGLIETSVGVSGGNFVKEVTLETIISPFISFIGSNDNLIVEMMEYRLVLETEIARLAAARRTEDDLNNIILALDRMRDEIDSGSIGLIGDNMFHEYVAIATHNEVFVHMQELAKTLLVKTRESALKIQGIPEKGFQHHRLIFEAVKKGDGQAAADAMYKHISEAMINVQKSSTDEPRPSDL